MNNKGFAISGILYSVLALFIMLLLLILGNFQSRKVLFDKQKNTVLQKLEGITIIKPEEFCNTSLGKFITPIDGTYRVEMITNSNKSISGEIELYQGILLYIKMDSDNISIDYDANATNSSIMSYIDNDCYFFSDEMVCKRILNRSGFNKFQNTKIEDGKNKPSSCSSNYVVISYLH